MKLNIGVTESKRKEISKVLNILLSSESVLYIHTRKAHWNVKGDSFMELHKLFAEQYKVLETEADELAERIAKFDCDIVATMAEYIKLSLIKEESGKPVGSKSILKNLHDAHEKMIRELRSYIAYFGKHGLDAGTTDYLTQLMLKHETMAWVLRRYLS